MLKLKGVNLGSIAVAAMLVCSGCGGSDGPDHPQPRAAVPTCSEAPPASSAPIPPPTPPPALPPNLVPPILFAKLEIRSDPPGAEVEVGLKVVGGVVTAGTGHRPGRTPCEAVIRPSDIDGFGNLNWSMTLDGYMPAMGALHIGPQPTAGRTYAVDQKLRKLGQ
jgi:hypothetical protein